MEKNNENSWKIMKMYIAPMYATKLQLIKLMSL